MANQIDVFGEGRGGRGRGRGRRPLIANHLYENGVCVLCCGVLKDPRRFLHLEATILNLQDVIIRC